MKTKITCLLLAMIMVIGMLASCAKGKDGAGAGGPGANSQQKPSDGGNKTGLKYDTYWKDTPIVYELTEASDAGQFTAGTRRYYAGDAATSTKLIDVAIRERNSAAEKVTKTIINYKYLPDTTDNDWSRSVLKIFENSTTYTQGKSVDIYCNFVYDLTAATVKNCFANLKSTDYGMHKNFFRFNDSDYEWATDPANYFNSGLGEGYFYEYMRSLTLSDDKVYCIGSDYCTDLVRAFHVVPVNIALLNTLDIANDEAFDDLKEYIEGGYTPAMSNINFFYQLVWGGHWDYTMLLKFSGAVYEEAGTSVAGGKAGADITDVLGFAISGGGLPASGILYTSSVQIVNKHKLTASEKANLTDDQKKNVAGDYLITYPATNPAFNNFASALDQLFELGKQKGVCFVDNTGGADSIRDSFVGNKMLFGSIISLGSLEDSDYQGMRSDKGFGVLPVPVYQAGDEYQTFVHNNARIIAVARMTAVFEQVSAYLDFQSRSSSDILEMYYNEELTASVAGTVGDQNVKMLKYIRNHVRNVFDKTYEDVMGDFNKANDSQADLRRWHEIIRQHGYQVSNMNTVYKEEMPDKAADLQNVIKAWNDLP